MATAKVTINNRVIMDITDTTATAETIRQGYTAYGADGVKVTGTYVGGGGQIESVTQDQNGRLHLDDDEGTQIIVDPLSVTQNATYTAPTGHSYSPVTVNVSSGGWQLVESYEVSASTTSTSSVSVDSRNLTSIVPYKGNKLIYIRISDKLGKRNGYFYQSDAYLYGFSGENFPRVAYSFGYSSTGTITGDKNIGVYVSQAYWTTAAVDKVTVPVLSLTISAKKSSLSQTIDGDYVVSFYVTDFPGSINPFD